MTCFVLERKCCLFKLPLRDSTYIIYSKKYLRLFWFQSKSPRNSLVPDTLRSPRHSLTPENNTYGSRLSLSVVDYNRSPRHSLVPSESTTWAPTIEEASRSPRHSIVPESNRYLVILFIRLTRTMHDIIRFSKIN